MSFPEFIENRQQKDDYNRRFGKEYEEDTDEWEEEIEEEEEWNKNKLK